MRQQQGAAHAFWRRLEKKRIALEWTKSRLSQETIKHTADGHPIPRTTIDRLRTQTRPPHPRIVNALADAVGLDRDEAAVLAGLIPPAPPPEPEPLFTEAQKRAVLAAMDAANRAGPPPARVNGERAGV